MMKLHPWKTILSEVMGEFLIPEEIREIVTYVNTYREVTDPFDVAVNSELPTDPR